MMRVDSRSQAEEDRKRQREKEEEARLRLEREEETEREALEHTEQEHVRKRQREVEERKRRQEKEDEERRQYEEEETERQRRIEQDREERRRRREKEDQVRTHSLTRHSLLASTLFITYSFVRDTRIAPSDSRRRKKNAGNLSVRRKPANRGACSTVRNGCGSAKRKSGSVETGRLSKRRPVKVA